MSIQFQPELEANRAIISQDDADFFAREGFLVAKTGFDQKTTAELRAEVEDVLRQNPDMCDVAVLPYVSYRLPTEGLHGGKQLFRYGVHPTILTAVHKLLGPDVLLWGGEILVKHPETGKPSDWHQDCVVATLRPGAGRDEPRGVNVWIAIDDVDIENACMRFVPGSSALGRLDHHLDLKDPTKMDSFPFSPDTDQLCIDEAFDAVMPAGHFSIHDLYAVHGSRPNISNRRRAALTFRYLDANDAFDRNVATVLGNAVFMRAGRPIWLVLGENKNDRNNFMIGHEGLDELDTLADETRQKLNAELNQSSA